MNRPVRTLFTLLSLWLLGACEQSRSTPSSVAKDAQGTAVRYFGQPADGKLHVYFLDVDHGDATLIVSPTGRTVLIDAGPAAAGAHLANRLPELLNGPLDLVVLTHPHPDHYGGLSAALSAVGARQLLEPQLPGTPADYDALLGAIGASGMDVVSPAPPANADALRLPLGGDTELTVLWPRAPTESLLSGDNLLELNSIVLRLTYRDTAVLLTGDAQEKTEQMLLRRGAPLRATLLKVAAHGAATASSAAFLDAVRPRAAVVTTGALTPENRLAPGVLARLESRKARVYRTDSAGEVHAVSDGQRFSVTTQLHPAGSEQDELEVFEGKSEAPEETAAADAGSAPRDAGSTSRDAGGVPGAKPAEVDIDLDRTPAPAPAPTVRREDKPTKPADGKPRYGASRQRPIFHRMDCPTIGRIKDENLVTFSTREEALRSGRWQPARDCNP